MAASQGGEQPRQELHRPKAQGTDAAARRKHYTLSGGAGPSGSGARYGDGSQGGAVAGQSGCGQSADATPKTNRPTDGNGAGWTNLINRPGCALLATSGPGTGNVCQQVTNTGGGKHPLN